MKQFLKSVSPLLYSSCLVWNTDLHANHETKKAP